MKWSLGSQPVGGVLLGQGAKVLSGSARAVYPRHQGSRRCKEQQERHEDKRDEDEGDEVNGEVEEIRDNAHRAHENMKMTM